MEVLVWISQATIPLFGWWLLSVQLQKLAAQYLKSWEWGKDFRADFGKAVLTSFFHATPEHHGNVVKQTSLPLRVRMLWLGLRSLSFGFLYLLTFGIWSWVPASVFLVLGLVLFIGSRWWKQLQGFAIFCLALGLFLYGYEWLFQASSQLTRASEDNSWIFVLSQNYLAGAVIGCGLGFLIRLMTRLSGVAWWIGTHGLLAGILSLGSAWGFILGDFLAGLAEDLVRHRDRDFRIRVGIGIAVGILGLLLTNLIQGLAMIWMNGQYSVELRLDQLAVMTFLFLSVESAIALTFFHFYFMKVQNRSLVS